MFHFPSWDLQQAKVQLWLEIVDSNLVTPFQHKHNYAAVTSVTFTACETYVSSPDFSRQISASCTAALTSSVSSDVMFSALALLFLEKGTDIEEDNYL